jgi:hypothetical protein
MDYAQSIQVNVQLKQVTGIGYHSSFIEIKALWA